MPELFNIKIQRDFNNNARTEQRKKEVKRTEEEIKEE